MLTPDASQPDEEEEEKDQQQQPAPQKKGKGKKAAGAVSKQVGWLEARSVDYSSL